MMNLLHRAVLFAQHRVLPVLWRLDARPQELERLVQLRTAELERTNLYVQIAHTEIEKHLQTVSEQAWEIATINTQLQARNHELEYLNHIKDEFLGIAAHELKNPLTSIVLTTEMLQDNIDKMSPSRIVERLVQIESTAMRMRDIVSDLLDVNALESGKLTLHMDAYDAGMLAEDVVGEYRAHAAEKGIVLHLDYDVELCNREYMYADFAKAREVLENLVSNAVKYSPLGKQVFVRVVSDSVHLRIEVADEGPGLSVDDQARLFQRFVRLTAEPTAGEHSSGLGLSIAKKLMEAMRGKIWCESELGKGATFVIEFCCAHSLEEALIEPLEMAIL